MKPVPAADPRAVLTEARSELINAFTAVLDGGVYILGDEVKAFEQEWASYCGTAHAVGVSSGTDALALALRALGIGEGDEVLVPAMTAVATWMAVSQIGAKPVGVDVVHPCLGMDPARAQAAVGPRTKALIAVHLFGQPADVQALERVATAAGVPLVEDAAQAHGAKVGERMVGSFGRAAAFSFYPTKNLGAIGDAGAITTDDPVIADRVRSLRQYGWRTRADAESVGVNARLDELQAALLRVMLPRLDNGLDRRRTIVIRYLDGLRRVPDLGLPRPARGTHPAWHQFVVHHPRRDALAMALAEAGVGTAIHYTPAPALNTAFRPDGWREGDFPVADWHSETALSLPLFPTLGDADVDRVIAATRNACAMV